MSNEPRDDIGIGEGEVYIPNRAAFHAAYPGFILFTVKDSELFGLRSGETEWVNVVKDSRQQRKLKAAT
jgi:hypothetical protein